MAIWKTFLKCCVAGVFTVGLVGCPQEEGPGEEAGTSVDEAAETTEEAAEGAAKETEEAADEAAEKVEEATDPK